MEKLISIIGLTSSGKSDLAIKLALHFDGEIVSADSRQVYKGLDWCSGKVSKDEMNEIRHHLIDVCDMPNQFTLFDFQKQAYTEIDDILSRKKIPFLVGGTGLYSRSVVEGYSLSEKEINNELRNELETKTFEELKHICDEKKLKCDGEITKRKLIRLIECENDEQLENVPRYDVLQIGIFWSRDEIYQRIEKRLKLRMPHMIEEIKNLIKSGIDKNFLLSLGLEAKNIILYLDGKFSSYEEFFENLLKEERHFAKRQKTWYNKEKNVIWLDAKDNLEEKAINLVEQFLHKN